MAATFQHASSVSSSVSSRVTSLIYGVLMSAIVLASVPGGLTHTIGAATNVAPTTVAAATAIPVPTKVAKPVKRAAAPDVRAVTAYLAHEWKLGRAYAAQVASAVMSAGRRHRVDPVLLLSMAAAESSLQHSVGNPGGGADPMKPYGIMQVAGQYHAEKFPGGVVKRTTVRENVDIGARVLNEYLTQERGNERRALLRYNGSLNISDKYFRKVNRFKQRIGRDLRDYQNGVGDDQPA